MSTCTICPRAAPDGHHACTACTHQLREMLAELPRQLPLLQDSLQPQGRPQQSRLSGAGSAHAPLPLDLRVLTLLGPGNPEPPADDPDAGGTIPIRPLVSGWAGLIAYEHPAVTRNRHGTTHIQPCEAAVSRHGQSIGAWCHWLTAYLPYATTRPWIADLHRQLDDLLALIRNLTGSVPHRHPKDAPCPRCQAFALVQTDGQWGITCEACGEHLEPDAYTAHAAAVLAALQATHTTDEHPADTTAA